MGTKLYNKMPDFLKEMDNYEVFKSKLKLSLSFHAFYSMEEFVSL